jgi:mannose/cellobiose epimerase-like protein (N-acyl-D-glucosamine 2-epimerase family)
MYRATDDPAFADDYRQFWDYAATYIIDAAAGSWHHELDARNAPATGTWAGKPDIYHALQATLLPRLPLSPSLATALGRGYLP